MDADGVDLDETRGFVADAVEHLASELGEAHPMVAAGRRVMASLQTVPGDAVLVTAEDLAAAIQRAFPTTRNTSSNVALSAATILAALRQGRRG